MSSSFAPLPYMSAVFQKVHPWSYTLFSRHSLTLILGTHDLERLAKRRLGLLVVGGTIVAAETHAAEAGCWKRAAVESDRGGHVGGRG